MHRPALALLLLAAPARAQSPATPIQRTFTLDDAERLARLNSADLLAAEQDIAIAQYRVQETRFLFLPEVGVMGSATKYEARYPFALAPEFRSLLLFPSDRENIYSSRAYLTYTVYDGRRHFNLLRLSQSALRRAQSAYDALKLTTTLETKRVFYELILAQERLAAVGETLRKVQAALGRAAGWDRVETEALASELRAREARGRHDSELAQLDFRRELNLELDTPVKVAGTLEARRADIDLERAVVWAMELRPELQGEIFKAQMDDIAVNLALSRRLPSLIVAADYEVTAQTFPLRQNNWDATIGLKIPFSFEVFAQAQQKRAEKRQGEIKRADVQDRVRLEVRRAHADLQFWQAEWPQREKEFMRLKTLSAAAGPIGSPSSVRAQLALLDSQDRFLEAVKEQILARAKVERAVGRALSQ